MTSVNPLLFEGSFVENVSVNRATFNHQTMSRVCGSQSEKIKPFFGVNIEKTIPLFQKVFQSLLIKATNFVGVKEAVINSQSRGYILGICRCHSCMLQMRLESNKRFRIPGE